MSVDVLFFENPGFFHGRVNAVQISLYLFTTAMVDEFPSHNAADIGLTVFGRYKIALHVMHTRANNHRDLSNPFIQYNHIHGLPTFRIDDRNRFVFHGAMSKVG